MSDNRFLWKCDSCSKRFHAACIGVKREHEDLVREYMIPACSECQSRVSVDLNIKELICQQSLLSDQIKLQTEVNHRSTQKLLHDSVLHGALDHIEAQLDCIKSELKNVNKASSSTAAICTIKNQVSSFFNDMLEAVNTKVIESLKSSMVSVQNGIDGIGIMTNEISDKLLHHCKEDHHTNPVNMDMLDELKALSAAFTSFESKLQAPLICPTPTIADELEEIDLNLFAPSANDNSDDGWKWFKGRRTIWKKWKADWNDDSQHKTVKHRSNRNRRRPFEKVNQDFDNNYNNVYFNYNNNVDNNINNKRSTIWTKGGSTPPDKALLEAAKRQFTGPPAVLTNSQFIRFRQGETLNPSVQTSGSRHTADESWSMMQPLSSRTSQRDPIFLY